MCLSPGLVFCCNHGFGCLVVCCKYVYEIFKEKGDFNEHIINAQSFTITGFSINAIAEDGGRWNFLFVCFSGLGDSFDPCAAEVHTMCSQTFLDLMKQDQRICEDSAQWFACYSKIAKKKNCNSPIIKNYAAFVEKIGIQLISDALFANSCNIAM